MLNKATLILSFGSVILMMSAIVLSSRDIIPPRVGLMLFALSGVVGLIAVGFAIAVIFRTQAFHIAMVGVLGALPAIVLFANIANALRYPPINDITSNLEEVPAFVHAGTLAENAGRDMTYPEKWIGIVRKAYPELASATVARPAAEVFPTVVRQAEQQAGWVVTHQDPATGTIECVATTKLFHFKDDIVIRLRPTDDGKTRVDMRSKSREGRSDIGANAKRIQAFLSQVR